MNVRSSTRAVAVGVTVAAALAAALAASPATAAVDAHDDAVRDVVLTTSEGSTSAPANKTADITSFTVAHTAKKVVVKIRLRDLRDNEPFAVLQLRAAGSSERYMATWLRDQDQDERLYLAHASQMVDCPSLRAAASFEGDLLTISMNRSCLGSPKWVRVGGMMGVNGHGAYYLDFSHREGGATVQSLEAGGGVPLGAAVSKG